MNRAWSLLFLSLIVVATCFGIFGAGYVVGRSVESRRFLEKREALVKRISELDSVAVATWRESVRDSAKRTLMRRFYLDSASKRNETERDIAYILDYVLGGFGD